MSQGSGIKVYSTSTPPLLAHQGHGHRLDAHAARLLVQPGVGEAQLLLMQPVLAHRQVMRLYVEWRGGRGKGSGSRGRRRKKINAPLLCPEPPP